jgi:hypothetical protein
VWRRGTTTGEHLRQIITQQSSADDSDKIHEAGR